MASRRTQAGREAWLGFGAAVLLTTMAVAAGWYASAKNGLTVDSAGKLVPAHASATDPFLIVMYVLMAVGMYFAVAALSGSLWLPGVSGEEKRRDRPPLRIEFDEYDAQCVQDRRQVSQIEDMQLRVRVTNAGHVGLRDVRVRLIESEPQLFSYFLAIIHDRDPFPRSTLGESCAIHQDLYFDVAFIANDSPSPKISYAHPNLTVLEHVGAHNAGITSFRLVLEAEGRWEDSGEFVPRTRETFRLRADSGALTLALEKNEH